MTANIRALKILDSGEIKEKLNGLDGWKLKKSYKRVEITKEYKFRRFREALQFVNTVGELAEKLGHHPDISIKDYNKVTLAITTHAIGYRLTEKDFILATDIDRLEW